jgi:ABC-type Fe3+-siderophore transport system permease subunit
MQSVLRNPLADASTLGVSQGAAFGATVAIICFGAGAQNTASAANAVTDMLPSIIAPARRPARSFLNFFILVSSLSLSSFPFPFGF